MTPDEYVEQVGQLMQADGCDVSWEQVGPVRALVGQRRDFRFFNVYLTTVVAAFPADAFAVGQFARDVSTYARDRAGAGSYVWGTTEAFAVIVCEGARSDAAVAASSPPSIEFTSRTQPVVIDTGTRQLHTFTGYQWWGSAFNGYKRRRLRKYLPIPT